jgi:hypothetical protein
MFLRMMIEIGNKTVLEILCFRNLNFSCLQPGSKQPSGIPLSS